MRIAIQAISSAMITASLIWPGVAFAQWHRFGGFDLVDIASVSPATNSLSAEASWIDFVGASDIHTVDFEAATPGSSGFLHTIAPGVRMSVIGGLHPDDLTVLNIPSISYPVINGFNSTQGGSHHMGYTSHPGTAGRQPVVIFSFDQPISSFSIFLTGRGASGTPFDFFNSTTIHAFGTVNRQMGIGDFGNPYWPSTDQPNVRFGGFVDGSESFTRVEVRLHWLSGGLDFPHYGSFSFDDIRWVYAPIPAPGTVPALVIAALCLTRRR
jgi:hypothetical protein